MPDHCADQNHLQCPRFVPLSSSVQRAARALARRFDDAFAAGWTDQRPVLTADGAQPALASAHGPGVVASRHGPNDADRRLKPLERRGLVIVAIDAVDRRAPHAPDAGRANVAGRRGEIGAPTHAEIERLLDGPVRTGRADRRALSDRIAMTIGGRVASGTAR